MNPISIWNCSISNYAIVLTFANLLQHFLLLLSLSPAVIFIHVFFSSVYLSFIQIGIGIGLVWLLHIHIFSNEMISYCRKRSRQRYGNNAAERKSIDRIRHTHTSLFFSIITWSKFVVVTKKNRVFDDGNEMKSKLAFLFHICICPFLL